jgi:Zn-dependent peptidase ImmA (M78 family)
MRVLAEIARKEFPHWNKKIISDVELQNYCETNGAVVVDHPTEHLGEYSLLNDKTPVIWIDPSLSGGFRHYVFAHEVGHFLYRHPFPQKFRLSLNQEHLFLEKLDFQADFFATIALVPKPELKIKSLGELAEEYGYSKEMLWIRKEIYERYKL